MDPEPHEQGGPRGPQVSHQGRPHRPLIPAALQARLADEARFPVDATLIDVYERTATRLAGKYITHDPHVLAPEAAAYADRALAHLDRPMAGELRHRLSAVAVSRAVTMLD